MLFDVVVHIATVVIQSFAYAYSGNQIGEHVEYSK